MKKIWIPAALMALAACSMTNNAEKGQGDSQDITARRHNCPARYYSSSRKRTVRTIRG